MPSASPSLGSRDRTVGEHRAAGEGSAVCLCPSLLLSASPDTSLKVIPGKAELGFSATKGIPLVPPFRKDLRGQTPCSGAPPSRSNCGRRPLQAVPQGGPSSSWLSFCQFGSRCQRRASRVTVLATVPGDSSWPGAGPAPTLSPSDWEIHFLLASAGSRCSFSPTQSA